MTFITTSEHIKKKKAAVCECSRLHIKPASLMFNCPDQLGPGTCVISDAFMDWLRLALCCNRTPILPRNLEQIKSHFPSMLNQESVIICGSG